MKPGLYRINKGMLGAPRYTKFVLKPDSRKNEICDVCGERKQCDWLECTDLSIIAGFDCCASCQKEVLVNYSREHTVSERIQEDVYVVVARLGQPNIRQICRECDWGYDSIVRGLVALREAGRVEKMEYDWPPRYRVIA